MGASVGYVWESLDRRGMKYLRVNWTRGYFSTQLMGVFFLLILATTLSAGLPAYWLTSSQLDAQTWSRIEGARTTTETLLQAAKARLEDSLLLFVERPTLRLLLAQNQAGELEEYI